MRFFARARRFRSEVSAVAAVALVVGAISSLSTRPAATYVEVDAAAAVSNPATIDALPTAQMNGVGWSQAIGGNAVYVAGQFTKARPRAAPPARTSRPGTTSSPTTSTRGT